MSNQPKIKTKDELIREIQDIIGEAPPAEIKNHEAYLLYLRYENNALHSKIINIGGVDYKLSLPYPSLQKYLKDAGLQPEDSEFKAVMKLKSAQMSLKMKANGALRKAYGTIVNGKGEKVELKSVLDPYKQELIEMFGRMFTSKEVHEYCLTKWKLIVKLQTIMDFRRNNVAPINKLIEEHQRTFSDIRLGHKRSRLEELVWMYTDRKRIYESTKKSDDYRLMLSTLNQIKLEAEGDTIRIDGNVNININEAVDNHVQKTLMKTINVKEIIIGRIAAKTNVSPLRLLAAINSSQYRPIIEAEDIDHEVISNYPSLQSYDFERIKRQQQVTEAETEAAKAKEAVVDIAKVKTGKTLLELLNKKLEAKKGDINFAKNSLSGDFIDKANDTEKRLH